MDTHKNDIEKLFSTKFERFEIQPSEKEWLNLSSKLSRMNFWKFSSASFNIYYLVVIIALAGTVVWLSVSNIQLSGKIDLLRDALRTNKENDRIPTTPATNSISPVISSNPHPAKHTEALPLPVQSKTKKEMLPIKESDLKKGELPSIPDQKNKDSIRNITPIVPLIKPTADTSVKNTVKIIKKVLIVKPKPVVIKDTVRITRPSK
jgi:hypothetical protein